MLRATCGNLNCATRFGVDSDIVHIPKATALHWVNHILPCWVDWQDVKNTVVNQ